MKEVTLKIIGTQTTFDGEENSMELITKGKFYDKGDSYFLVYEESEISGMEGSTTTLKIKDKKVLMKRFGTNTSSLMFEKGIRHKCEYETAYGNMDMEIVTNHMEIDIDKDGKGKIELKYKLNVMDSETVNKLNIDILSCRD